MKDFLMVIMASGIARGRVRTTTATTRTHDDGHTPKNRLTDIQLWFTMYLFDIGHPCYDQLIPVKTSYPLITIT